MNKKQYKEPSVGILEIQYWDNLCQATSGTETPDYGTIDPPSGLFDAPLFSNQL